MTDKDFPAFPRQHDKEGHNGMTLRNYFAAKAMAAYLIAAQGNTPEPEQTANDAYFMADAMLKASSE